ncbi:MAG TPA: hypothetical protein VHZ03_15785 [Trebonia sp.]|nr:hypothetical protein [Trebonia sp.]
MTAKITKATRFTGTTHGVAAADEQVRLIEALLTLARGQRGLARRDPGDLAAVTRDVLAVRCG